MFHILGRNRSSRSPSRSPESTRFFTRFRGGASRPTGSSTVGRSESSEPAVPYKTVRLLLLGELSPIDLANELLSPEEALRVKHINTCGFRPKVQLSDIKINTVEDVLFVGLCYAGFDQDRQSCQVSALDIGRFSSFYKAGPEIILDLRNHMVEYGGSVDFMHLLWALNFLKLYETEHVHAGRWGVCENTFRKHTWSMLERISAEAEYLIKFDVDEFGGEVHVVGVDTVNFIMQEDRKNPSKKWFDKKSHSAGLKYEFACPLFLDRQSCVWSRGPFPAGETNDGILFRGGKLDEPRDTWDKNALYFQLPAKGKAIADSAYVGTPEKCTTSMDEHPPWVTHIINRALAKGENYHGRMKQFGALYQRFRSGRRELKDRLRKHKICVDAVHVILYFELPHQPLQDV